MAAMMWVLGTPHIIIAANYGISAHGGTVDGVNRSGTGYAIGDCAHCHETYDEALCGVNDFMLFAPNNPASQTDNFCFQCHKGTATYCYHTPGDGSCTATWTPHLNAAGEYNVYARWVSSPSAASDAPYTIYYDAGSVTVPVDQGTNGGQWNLLGTYQFAAGSSGYVVLGDNADGYVMADAVRWELSNPPGSPDVVVDNPSAVFVCDWPCVDDPNAYPGDSVQLGGITNNTYSTNFGGGTPTLTTIYDAFNPPSGATPSSHNLADVYNYVVTKDIGFESNTNACFACHDQHLAQQNYPVVPTVLGGVKTAVRRPNDILTSPTNLWGDEDATPTINERMADATNKYRAPYFVGDFGYFEPANDDTDDGSNLPNFKNFCLVCHGRTDVYSTERGRSLRKIDWADEEHGSLHNGGMTGASIAPYTNHMFNYILACTDCHEPHGSKNEWLLRTTINGQDNISVPGSGEWSEVCGACHTWNTHAVGVSTCWGDGVWNCHRHGSGGSMF